LGNNPAIDTLAGVADEYDVRVQFTRTQQMKRDFVEATIAAFKNRAVTLTILERAGGGHTRYSSCGLS